MQKLFKHLITPKIYATNKSIFFIFSGKHSRKPKRENIFQQFIVTVAIYVHLVSLLQEVPEHKTLYSVFINTINEEHCTIYFIRTHRKRQKQTRSVCQCFSRQAERSVQLLKLLRTKDAMEKTHEAVQKTFSENKFSLSPCPAENVAQS